MKKFLLSTFVLLLGLGANFSLMADEKKPLKVFVLVGQSNMQGHAHVRTLVHLGMDADSQVMLDEIQNEKGEARVFDDIWISYLSSGGVKNGNLTTGFGADGNKIGPELMFGITMQKRLGEPILIIKAAWGGKSINTDFRPPSAGPYVFDDAAIERIKKGDKDFDEVMAAKREATGVFYRKTVEHVQEVLADIKSVYPEYDSEQGYELAGMVWFQGWNDMVDGGTYPRRGEAGGYDQYSEVLNHLIRDFRKDLDAPKLPFVIGVMGAGGPTSKYTDGEKRYQKIHQNFRDAMAAPAKREEFRGNVFAVATEDCWDLELSGIIARDGKIRNQVNKAKKADELGSLYLEVYELEKFSEEDLREIAELKSQHKLDKSILEKMRSKEFNDRERQVLENGPSNAAYHYLGSSKIMASIGKAFAEAMPMDQE